MKKALFCYIVINLICSYTKCQTEILPDSSTIYGSGERVRLFTDRCLYCVNERIFFTADYSFISETDSITWSKILYVELIKWNGAKISGLKLKIDSSGASGSLLIPGNLFSGNYYLRAYTKWMRNFSPNDYEYRMVKIVNPFTSTTDPGPADIPGSAESTIKLVPAQQLIRGVHCSMNKRQYRSREKAEVELTISDRSVVIEDYCVSVAKVGFTDTALLMLKSESKPSPVSWKNIEFLPEMTGMTISGKIVDESSKFPVPNALVFLSETENGEFFSVYKTKDNGRFVFSLPDMKGEHDFFIQAPETRPANFLTDNGFCDRPVLLPYIAFSINDEEKFLVREMVVNSQLSEIFSVLPDSVKEEQAGNPRPVPFYGTGAHVYHTEKYIELQDVEEFFNEIVLEANAVNSKGKTELKMSGNNGSSNYPPLIFLDNVMVSNDDRLLKIPLDKIERVEVIGSGYSVGSMKFSGLFSIYSRENDYAGIKLNKNGNFFSYDMFPGESACFNSCMNVDSLRIPYRPNILYWDPDVSLSPGRKTTFSFYTSDTKGDYVVNIFAKKGSGREIYGKFLFSVK